MSVEYTSWTINVNLLLFNSIQLNSYMKFVTFFRLFQLMVPSFQMILQIGCLKLKRVLSFYAILKHGTCPPTFQNAHTFQVSFSQMWQQCRASLLSVISNQSLTVRIAASLQTECMRKIILFEFSGPSPA